MFAWGLTACHGTPFETTEPEIEIDGAGAAPIVVIGTTRDPATPYEEAVAMAEQLESGVLLSRDGDGHTGLQQGQRLHRRRRPRLLHRRHRPRRRHGVLAHAELDS